MYIYTLHNWISRPITGPIMDIWPRDTQPSDVFDTLFTNSMKTEKGIERLSQWGYIRWLGTLGLHPFTFVGTHNDHIHTHSKGAPPPLSTHTFIENITPVIIPTLHNFTQLPRFEQGLSQSYRTAFVRPLAQALKLPIKLFTSL